jgi:UDP-3-O-acyl-N-acetylglucosamine deacetylase
VFVRTDLHPRVSILARIDQVTGTARRTTIGHAPHQVELIEHVMAALAGLRIDNCYVELDAPEPPGLDGSARGFVEVLHAAGTVAQPVRRDIWTVRDPITVKQPGATLTLHPGRTGTLRVSYFLDYGPGAPIDRQMHTEEINPATFAHSLAGCRTFVLEAEAKALRAQGLGSRTTPADLLIFGPHGPIDNRLRFSNEPARHKLLDLVGDLALFGLDLCGHVVAYRSGHHLNSELVRMLTHELEQCGCMTRRRAA